MEINALIPNSPRKQCDSKNSNKISLRMTFAPAASATNLFPFPYDQHDFPNGLRLITVPTGYPRIVSLQIVVQVGSRNETEPGKSGFAHLFEHMMFRGTPFSILPSVTRPS
jgi:hypothetical protein